MAVIAALSGIILGWLGRSRTVRQDTIQEAREDAEIKRDMEYIKQGIDNMRFELREQGKRHDDRINEHAREIARLDESLSSAHKRINRLEGSK